MIITNKHLKFIFYFLLLAFNNLAISCMCRTIKLGTEGEGIIAF